MKIRKRWMIKVVLLLTVRLKDGAGLINGNDAGTTELSSSRIMFQFICYNE